MILPWILKNPRDSVVTMREPTPMGQTIGQISTKPNKQAVWVPKRSESFAPAVPNKRHSHPVLGEALAPRLVPNLMMGSAAMPMMVLKDIPMLTGTSVPGLASTSQLKRC